MSAGKHVPPELLERLLKVARENPELNCVQLGERFGLRPNTVRRALKAARERAAKEARP